MPSSAKAFGIHRSILTSQLLQFGGKGSILGACESLQHPRMVEIIALFKQFF
jgi:hypothetical protein